MNYDILVNKRNPLGSEYIPENLVEVQGPTGEKMDPNYINKMDFLAYRFFLEMQKAALEEGYEVFIDSSYRSYEYQQRLFVDLVLKKGYYYALKYCAMPGSSEHQTGLAIDIILRRNGIMIDNFDESDPEIEWLITNSYNYGYILRYPKNKQSITGYSYEPWHYRFCCPALATLLHDNDETLEEYYIRQRIKE